MEYNIEDFNIDNFLNSIDPEKYNISGIPEGFWHIFWIIMGSVALVTLVYLIIIAISKWKMFKKGKQAGWSALIPIYSQYIQCKMVGVNPWWILIVFVVAIVSGIIPGIGSMLSLAVSIYFSILLGVSTARAFGKDDSFAIGLILLPIVFYPILGFGKSEYIGDTNPMNDFVFKKADEVLHTNSNKKFCPQCGTQMNNDSKFCPSCGKKVE